MPTKGSLFIAQLANKKVRWTNHPSGRAPQAGGLAPATLRGYVRAWRQTGQSSATKGWG